MERGGLIYLDNAATSFPKPQSVIEQMERFMLYCGGNAGRGGHWASMEAARLVFECRSRIAEFFDADGPERVCFTMNTTQGLNLCIKGLLREGDHVLISDMEHNAVYRPVYKLKKEGKIDFDIFPSMIGDRRRNAMRICAGIAKRMKRETRMVICSGISNICSAEMPLREIGAFCRRHGLIFVVDGAQCAGHMKISVKDMCIDALCVPGHKGLLGPQGCGAVIFGRDILADTLVEGGNGVASLEGDMPEYSPERYESGTLPTPAIIGLSEGVRAVSELGLEKIRAHEKKLFRRTAELLGNMKGIRVYYPQYDGSVLLFNVEGHSSDEIASRLNDAGICVRGGYHCSALGHKTLGTLNSGAVRVSFGVFNNSRQIDALAESLRRMGS